MFSALDIKAIYNPLLVTGWTESGTTDYQAAHTLILAHARAYRLYERKYKQVQTGEF